MTSRAIDNNIRDVPPMDIDEGCAEIDKLPDECLLSIFDYFCQADLIHVGRINDFRRREN